jgi:hypothetical protein
MDFEENGVGLPTPKPTNMKTALGMLTPKYYQKQKQSRLLTYGNIKFTARDQREI